MYVCLCIYIYNMLNIYYIYIYIIIIIIIIIITYVKIRTTLHKLNCCRGTVHEIRRRIYIMIFKVAIRQSIKRNDLRKRAVLRSRRNVDIDVADLSAPGSAFHSRGAATKKERSPESSVATVERVLSLYRRTADVCALGCR